MIYQILKELQSTPGKNDKIAILNKHKDNETLKSVVYLALNPFIMFYIKDATMPFSHSNTLGLEDGLKQLSKIHSREITGNEARQYVTDMLSKLHGDDAEVIRRVIKKDLECGVAESTVNKVWKDLIPVFPCLLASQMDDKVLSKLKFPCFSQKKEDGMRFVAIIKDGKCEFRSRNGKLIELHGTLEKEFLGYGLDNTVYDGELLVVDSANNILDRKTGNGILNKSVKGTITKEDANSVICTIWDMIPLQDFIDLKCNIPYNKRWQNLESSNIHKSNKINLVESLIVNSMEQAQEIFQNYLSQGHEGSILKSFDLKWSDTRSKDMIKLKAELVSTFKVIGWTEGTGKNIGKLGALTIESEDGLVKTDVGTGLTDKDREEFTKEYIIGKYVDIKYNARIRDKNSKTDALFLPVFVSIREDKTEADCDKDIK